MKKIFPILCLIVSTACAAEPVTMWHTTPGGTAENVCRQLMKSYEETYHEPTAFYPMAGLDGLLATRAMLASPVPEKLLCHGSSAMVTNQFVHSDIDHMTGQLQMVAKFADEPTVWYVPNSSGATASLATTMAYFKSLNRPVNVGIYIGAHKIFVKYLAKKYNVPLQPIVYKRSPEMFPGLSDGTIDLALDTGAGVAVAQSGVFRIAGYHSIKNIKQLSAYNNFYTENRELKDFMLWTGFSMAKNSSEDLRAKFAKRMEVLIKDPATQQVMENNLHPVNFVEGKELDQQLSDQIRATAQYWK